MIPASMDRISIHDLAQKFDLISRSLGVSTCRFDHFESGVSLGTNVTSESVPSERVLYVPPKDQYRPSYTVSAAVITEDARP